MSTAFGSVASANLTKGDVGHRLLQVHDLDSLRTALQDANAYLMQLKDNETRDPEYKAYRNFKSCLTRVIQGRLSGVLENSFYQFAITNLNVGESWIRALSIYLISLLPSQLHPTDLLALKALIFKDPNDYVRVEAAKLCEMIGEFKKNEGFVEALMPVATGKLSDPSYGHLLRPQAQVRNKAVSLILRHDPSKLAEVLASFDLGEAVLVLNNLRPRNHGAPISAALKVSLETLPETVDPLIRKRAKSVAEDSVCHDVL
jgi:hypothetical protein